MISSSLNNSSSFNNPSSQAFKSSQIAKSQSALPKEVLDALDTIQSLNLKIELCGSWMWIFGADSSHEAKLRAAGFKWSYKRGCWYFCPIKDKPQPGKPRPHRRPWDMSKIRQKYGSQIVQV